MIGLAKFGANTHGRDFFCGDVHGRFDLLSRELLRVGFEYSRDRLFCVGDLVDRGEFSVMSAQWLREPWFYAVRGNHEQAVIDAIAVGVDREWHEKNGGEWFYRLGNRARRLFAEIFAALPIAIEIETPRGLIGIVHCEVFGDWGYFCKKLSGDTGPIYMHSIWGRKRIRENIKTPVTGLAALVVGHAIVPEPMALGNSVYIDTGAYKTGRVTVMEVGGILDLLEK